MLEKMKQLMEMQKMAKDAQRRLEEISAEGTALGGRIRVVMKGNPRLERVSIEESLVAAGNRDSLERGIEEAVNQALSAVKEQAAHAAMEAMKGLNFPG